MGHNVEDLNNHHITSLFMLPLEYTGNSISVCGFKVLILSPFIFSLHLNNGNLMCACVVFVVLLRRF